jgi:hypothetical protein
MELVELYVEAMRRLEGAIEVMRKEGDELTRVVLQVSLSFSPCRTSSADCEPPNDGIDD